MNKSLLLLVAMLYTSIAAMAVAPKPDDKNARTPVYTIDFMEENYAFFDGKTDKPSTGIYAAGEKVVLYFPFIATDTDYSFYMDGKPINATNYDHKRGFVFEFVMPERNITFTWSSRNTMVNYRVNE